MGGGQGGPAGSRDAGECGGGGWVRALFTLASHNRARSGRWPCVFARGGAGIKGGRRGGGEGARGPGGPLSNWARAKATGDTRWLAPACRRRAGKAACRRGGRGRRGGGGGRRGRAQTRTPGNAKKRGKRVGQRAEAKRKNIFSVSQHHGRRRRRRLRPRPGLCWRPPRLQVWGRAARRGVRGREGGVVGCHLVLRLLWPVPCVRYDVLLARREGEGRGARARRVNTRICFSTADPPIPPPLPPSGTTATPPPPLRARRRRQRPLPPWTGPPCWPGRRRPPPQTAAATTTTACWARRG